MEVQGIQKSGVSETNTGHLRSIGRQGKNLKDDCPISHEFGHMLGLKDKYIKDPKNPNQTIPVSEEWRGNIMFESTMNPSTVDSKNMNILLKPALDIHNSKDGVKFSDSFPRIGSFFRLDRTVYKINRNQREK